jgi:hypothetical protein
MNPNADPPSAATITALSTLVFDCVGEWRIEVDADAHVFVRQLGGPVFYFGHATNVEAPRVSAWRARLPAARREALIAGFEEARSTMDGNPLLVPEERASVLRLGSAGLLVAHRSLEANAALDRVVAELSGLAAALRGCPSMERLANPERDQWRGLPPNERRAGPDAPAPDPTAGALAQSAVDRFYTERLDAVLAQVASRPRPRPASALDEPPPPLEDASHTFTCRATSLPAATIALSLTPRSGGGSLALSGFAPAGDVTARVNEKELPAIHRRLVAGDARSLWRHDDGLVPFYCSQCDASYAAPQWQIYETSPTRIEGMCPAGHRRRMSAR